MKVKLCIAIVLFGIHWAAFATEGDPNAAKGVVAEHCIACHEVPGFPESGEIESVDALPFLAYANAPETYTAERLKAFLRTPHFPMQQFIFSDRDISNLIAFIQHLRKQ